MRAPSSASRRGLTVYFRRDSFLSQLISVLLAWAMIMSSLPVYATDQPHAKWVHSWDFGSGPKATTPSPHKDVSATVARQRRALGPPQYLSKRRIAVQAGAHHQSVGKKADQPTQLFRIPVGNRRSHGHIVFTGVPAHQGLKSAEKRHEQRDLFLSARAVSWAPRAAGNRNATLPPLWLRTDCRAPTQHIDQRNPVTAPIPAPRNFRPPQYPKPIAR